ncbi:MAG: hypothetical protein LUD27_00630 [Clostridia bacterium]|nr:hypothetical protein [Clostridia bacterium]
MAYTDYTFYSESYYGDELTEDNAEKWLEKASDKLDALTFGRLTFAFPTVEAHAVKVKKAVCAIAEALYLVDVQRKATSAQLAADGTYRGAVASVSSGKESVSYSVNGSSASVYAAAAASESALNTLISDIAVSYISGIPDANSINLLYAGRR